MTRYNVEEILQGIRQNDIKVLQYVYKTFYSYVKYFIISNSGNEDDAKDIYQEVFLRVFKGLKNFQFK